MTTALLLRLPALDAFCVERWAHDHLFVSIFALVTIFFKSTHTPPLHRTACALLSILSVPNCEHSPHKFCLLAFGLDTAAGTTLLKSPSLQHARVLAFVMTSSSL
ncbi:hypothetical protein B0H13DRAFT_2343132 [Mycena leptocephala]|nr:hypothetical protein B0H13DRAFT_2343132 [Mycena leptocephala]